MSRLLYKAAVNICAVLLSEVLLRDYVKGNSEKQSDDAEQ